MAPDWDPDTLPTSADRNGPCPRCGRHAHFGIVHTTPLCAEPHIPDVGKEHVGVLTCMGCGLGTAVIEKELEPPEYTAIDWWPPPGVGNFDPHVPPAVRAFRYGGMRNTRTPVTKAEERGRGIIGEDAPSTPATARHRRTSRRRRNKVPGMPPSDEGVRPGVSAFHGVQHRSCSAGSCCCCPATRRRAT